MRVLPEPRKASRTISKRKAGWCTAFRGPNLLTNPAVTSGQDVLRSLILSGEDRRRFFIHPRCTRTVEAFKNYRATELAEGIYDPRPDPDPSNHTYSHGTDQARYLCR